MRVPSMFMAGLSGALGGFCLAYQVCLPLSDLRRLHGRCGMNFARAGPVFSALDGNLLENLLARPEPRL